MTKYLFFLISFTSFSQSSFYGKLRYYHMATDNNAQLPDYDANAISGELGIKYKFNSFLTAEAASSLTSSFLNSNSVPTSRYEIGLFDQANQSNQTFLSRIEKLNLQYAKNNFKLTVGRQVINTPFINPQDGRMRPSAVGGMYGQYKHWEFAYLYEMSPRGTMGWSSVASSIGYYPVGINTIGQKSSYAGQLKSNGILITGFNQQINKNLGIKFSNLFVDQISNTTFLQLENQHQFGSNKLTLGIQVMKQNAIGDNTFDEKNQHSASWGLKFALENSRWSSSINFNQISSEGRYLMPREWGKDPFYTFMPRERNEGYGDVKSVVVKCMYQVPSLHVKIQPSVGYFDLPAIDNFALNKYGMPSYVQTNLEITWDAKTVQKGLEVQFVFVNKSNQGETYNNPKYILNKVDMSTWNFIVNYQL